MIKGILFDKDGTLIGFESMWHQIMTAIFSRFEEELKIAPEAVEDLKKVSGYRAEGFEKESIVQYLSTREIIDIWIDRLSGFGIRSKNMRERMLIIFEAAATDKNNQIVPLTGVQKTLEYLYSEGYHLGIATADTHASAMNSLKQTNLLQFFDFIGTDDGKLSTKPHPEMAELFCLKTGIRKEELLIVGDSISDLHFAQNTGAKFAGLLTSYNKFETIPAGDFILIKSIEEIIGYLRSISEN